MIKGSTKVGEIFLISQATDGVPQVQSQFLGKAITGLGGGCAKMFVIEEGDGYQGILNPLHPFDSQANEQFYSAVDDENKSAIIVTNSAAGQQKPQYQSSPFDQQQNFYQIQKPPLTNVDQRIEERESLRHSTHRSQRSERLGSHQNHMQQTTTERFGNTDYNSDHIERPPFQNQSYNRGDSQQNQKLHNVNGGGEDNIQNQEEGSYMDVQHQMDQDGNYQDDEPSKMFTFDDQNNVNMQEERQSQRSGGLNQSMQKNQFQGNPSRTQNLPGDGAASGSMGHLMSVASGRNHSLHLTRDGDVFSYGSGTFSAVGHGGSKGQVHPTVLKPLRDKRIVQVACGENHSLVLTDKADVFAWGRGFEGQLGLSKSIEIASTPQYIKSFYGKPVNYIAAGAFYSLAITRDGSVWGWGEAKLGQLGMGKQREVRLPAKIQFDDENAKNFVQCSAGYGHSAALTQDGQLYTWGFNNYGQCGQQSTETIWRPRKVSYYSNGWDYSSQDLPITKVKCSYYSTFIINQQGIVYSCGKGPIGACEQSYSYTFSRITQNTDKRIFTDVFTNENSVVLYAPIRVYDVAPKCGPASGNTSIKIFGTGFVNSDKLRVRYSYGDLSQEVPCLYDVNEKCLIAKTPKFEEFEGEKHPSLVFPCNCIISVTMDGIHYSECEEVFKIYSNEIYLTSINPKCGSVQGGTTLTLLINIDEVTAANLYSLTIGFQPKKNSPSSIQQSKKYMEKAGSQANTRSYQSLNHSNHSSVMGSRAQLHNNQDMQYASNQEGQVNGEDENTTTSPGWTCTYASYENGTIICTVPSLQNYDQESLQFNVDVALNGQQFTGRPLQFRYYDINIEKIEPSLGPSEGGTVINIMGQGLYDSAAKRVKFEINQYERVVTAQWDRKLKCLQCIVPPLTWLFGGVEVPEDQLEQIKKTPIKVLLTFNNQEWISAKEFRYHDCKVDRIAYAHTYGNDIADLVERERHWKAEELLEVYPPEMPYEEIKKKEDEKAKKAQEEAEESMTVAKRKGVKIFIHGQNFVKTDNLKVKFSHASTGVSKEVNANYKNTKKVGCEIPDMGGDVPVGQHHLIVEVSLNGQQYTSNGVQFLFNSVDPNLTEEELKKMDELEEKNQKKPAPKKK